MPRGNSLGISLRFSLAAKYLDEYGKLQTLHFEKLGASAGAARSDLAWWRYHIPAFLGIHLENRLIGNCQRVWIDLQVPVAKRHTISLHIYHHKGRSLRREACIMRPNIREGRNLSTRRSHDCLWGIEGSSEAEVGQRMIREKGQ